MQTIRPRWKRRAGRRRFCKLSPRRRRGGRCLQHMAPGPHRRGDVVKMNQTTPKKRQFIRITQIALGSAAFALLTACGGGGSDNNNNASATPAGGVKLQVV